MSFLFQSGLAALGLVAVVAMAPAQTVIQAPMTQVEVNPSGDVRVRAPFFRLFQWGQSPAPQPTTISQTAEPPLAAPIDAGSGPVVPPSSGFAPVPPTPYRSGPALSDPNSGYQPVPPPYSAYQPTPTPNSGYQPAPAPYSGYQPMPGRQAAPAQPPQSQPQGPAPSHTEFASTFQPLPGQYQVLILHPFTGQPVTVSFRLPPSRGAYRIRATARYVEFDAPDHTVDIRFSRDGKVFVDQD